MTKRFFCLILLITQLMACSDLIVTEPDDSLNMADFEAAWSRVNMVYPYLEFKGIDWDSIYNVYKPRVEQARGDEFYPVLHNMLFELRDGHAYYHTDGGGEVYPYVPVRHLRDRHAYSPFVVRKYFDRELRLTESTTVEYEILPGRGGMDFLPQKVFNTTIFTKCSWGLRNRKGVFFLNTVKSKSNISRINTGPVN